MIIDLNDFQFPACWHSILSTEFEKNYFIELNRFLIEQQKFERKIFPSMLDVFNCFFSTPFKNVRVVILGQDPYHQKDQANGLAFSVKKEIKIPPSLNNIYKEIYSDFGGEYPKHGDLTNWANQGVLLLNSTLTVEEKKPGSHHGKGWEIFTDRVIHYLNQQKRNIVFFLWGEKSISKKNLIDHKKHLILTSPHPSPLSAYRGFFGNRHFSTCNDYLKGHNLSPINWAIE